MAIEDTWQGEIQKDILAEIAKVLADTSYIASDASSIGSDAGAISVDIGKILTEVEEINAGMGGSWGGNVYSANKLTPITTVSRWEASEKRLTKITIINTDVNNYAAVGAYTANITTFRANAYILRPLWGIHLYDVDVYTLGYAANVDYFSGRLHAIGVEE